jgi:hypothetical protein
MKRLKKGPELRMPELKVPDFVADVFYDLHDRRLLAPIALVIVAIVAVPFLLGGGSERSPAEPGVGAAISGVEAESAKAASLTVVEAKPGLRDYRKRLADRRPTDPFKQRYTAPDLEGSELGSPTESSSSSSTTVTNNSSSEATTISTETTTTPAPSSSPSSPPTTQPAPSGGGSGKRHLTFFAWSIDVWISKAGGKDAAPSAEPEANAKHKVLPQTPLPGEKAPVVTYMGLSRKAAEKHAAKALLLVSDDVKSVSGEAKCAGTGGEGCQLFEVAPGSPLTFVYGANETRYTIKVLKIALAVTGHS